MILPLLIAVAQESDAPISVTAYPWAPYISPMGEPFRSQAKNDDPFVRWFRQADRNHDGFLTSDEMVADGERFFETIDSNHDGKIDAEELVTYEFKVAPEVQVNSNWKETREAAAAERSNGERGKRDRNRRRGDNGVDGYQINGLQGAARYSLLNIPEPVAGADLDLNGNITLDEFRRSAAYRFQLLDSNRQGKLTLPELESLLPSRPHAGQRSKPRKDIADPRVGLPFPGDRGGD
jgi:Ca2+-binding EF-hand superfamily protein